jgi:hypothetical protein
MKRYNLNSFIKWWFIWAFENTLFKTEWFEVAVKFYKKWDRENSHHHKVATEYTIFHSGKFKMKNNIYEIWDIVEILPWESSDFECLEDWSTTVVKIPSVIWDKYVD